MTNPEFFCILFRRDSSIPSFEVDFAIPEPVTPSVSQNPNLRLPDAPRPGPADEPRLRMEREMAKKANLQRQADLKRDTDKLLKLANELKESVDKTNEGTLSVDVVKKAEEIEKLAHRVKDKMKGSY
jgi:hypothetical protein